MSRTTSSHYLSLTIVACVLILYGCAHQESETPALKKTPPAQTMAVAPQTAFYLLPGQNITTMTSDQLLQQQVVLQPQPQQALQPASLVMTPTAQTFVTDATTTPIIEPTHTLPKPKPTGMPPSSNSIISLSDPKEIDFEIENQTGKTIFATCFSYIKKRTFTRWRWDKSEVYRLEPGESTIVDIDSLEDYRDRKNVFGYLAVFDTEQEANDAIYELLSDRVQIDLDLLADLKGKKVVISVEKYGIRGKYLAYDFVECDEEDTRVTPELDFPIQNKTGKPLLVTCFVYQKKAKGTWIAAVDERDDMVVWRYDKTPIIRLEPGEIKMIDVDTITEKRDREYVQGFLALFEPSEAKEAEDSTFELLEIHRKITLGLLSKLKDRKIVLEIEKYGSVGNFIDYTTKPISKIDFTKITKEQRQP